MAQNNSNDRLNNISSDDLDIAQKKLDALCKKHEMKNWKIGARRADWKELCYRIIGLPYETQKPSGRTPVVSEYTKYLIPNLVLFYRTVPRPGEKTNGKWVTSLERACDMVAQYLIKEKLMPKEVKNPGGYVFNYYKNEGAAKEAEIVKRFINKNAENS